MWFAFYGALLTGFKYWLMRRLTNTLKCDLNSKNLFFLPNWETMEQWHLRFTVALYFLALTPGMRWSLFICVMRTILSQGCVRVCLFWDNNFSVMSSAELTTLYTAVARAIYFTWFCFCFNHGIKTANKFRLFFPLIFQNTWTKLIPEKAEGQNTDYDARKSWLNPESVICQMFYNRPGTYLL